MLLTSTHEMPWTDEEPQTNAKNAHVCATPLLTTNLGWKGFERTLTRSGRRESNGLHFNDEGAVLQTEGHLTNGKATFQARSARGAIDHLKIAGGIRISQHFWLFKRTGFRDADCVTPAHRRIPSITFMEASIPDSRMPN